MTAKLTKTLCLLAIGLAALTGVACGDTQSDENAAVEARIDRERTEAAKQAKLEAKVAQLEDELKKKQKSRAKSAGSSNRSASSSNSGGARENAGSWPSGTSAWTVILVSAGTRSEAESVASRARSAGLDGVGILYSSDHGSLRPGYWIAYSGVLSKTEAAAHQGEVRASGFGDAYARYVSAN